MTKKLFYDDAYQTTFSATVLEVKKDAGQWKILLDQTAFYPEGGGQNADTGRLLFADGTSLHVIDVQEDEEKIWHTVQPAEFSDGKMQEQVAFAKEEENAFSQLSVAKGAPTQGEIDLCTVHCCGDPQKVTAGMKVQGEIDWERRFDYMQQHSGEHIVSGMICSRFHCDNVGFHLGEEIVLIDYNAPVTYEEALEIETAANRYIWENHDLEVQWPSAEKLRSIDYRSKKELEGDVRIVSFPGADTCACCGTHVSSSAQVGLVKFLSAKPFHGGTRLELLCGKRAMDYLVVNHRENKEIGVLLSAKEAQTADRVKKLLEENARLKMTTAALEDKVFPVWADRFLNRGDSFVADDQLSAAQGRRLADLIADRCGGIAAVFTKVESGYAYAIISRNTELKELINNLNAELKGRGGGRNGFAQGTVAARRGEIQNFFADFYKAE